MSAVVRHLNDLIAERVARSIEREPAKVVALKLHATERHARGLQRREHGPSAGALFLLCMEDAELRDWCVRMMTHGPDSDTGRAIQRAILRRLGEDATP